jgi:hypothetical protein
MLILFCSKVSWFLSLFPLILDGWYRHVPRVSEPIDEALGAFPKKSLSIPKE